MDFSLVLMLSSLLQLQDSLESPSSDTSSPAPLLFFTLITVLAHAAALYAETSGDYWSTEQQKTFRSLITEQMKTLDPAIRDTQWRQAYGMSFPLFVMIVDEVKPFLLKQELYGGETMPPDAAVAMVLYRLSSGHNLRRIASEYKTGSATITKYTDLVTKALATKLYSKYIKIPSGETLAEIITAFKDRTGLQNMCGAIDGSHVKIHKRPDKEYSPGNYKCRHHFFAVLLQVVCDHRRMFWDVCCKAAGSTDDATHLRGSSLFQKLTNGEVLVDTHVRIKGNHIRPYIVGDWGYPLFSFLLTPFTGNGSGTPAQNFFDERLMKGRAMVEEAISLLKGRWKILQNLNVGLNYAAQTVVACCVLHNICMLAEEPEPPVAPDPSENGPIARALDTERSLNYFGESMRQLLLEDLQERNRNMF
ncbi:nuclease HARBI1 [Marchantia polymorpha subsp. ruderalis]|uniref:DDE Tnp4 domain-containing protein n=1 Tax=Marchantia polymorpha subsp. ruderalis TaxID=1480154 RepID=A0AAF6BG91_MARPO|nr:hypothetical protein Mp_5g08430 [Marchantia polymorpha subsp. ruderalis]